MKKIILCEGKSDAVLISYYLIKTNNWEFNSKSKLKKLNFSNENESFDWYKREDDNLAIWGVGGKDNFEVALKKIYDLNFLASSPQEIFSSIVIIADRDNLSINEKIHEFISILSDFNIQSQGNNVWSSAAYNDSFGVTKSINIGFVIIPFTKEGALETFLLNALSEDSNRETIVTESREFVYTLNPNPFLSTPRLQLKAWLAVSLAIFSPEKVFNKIDEVLQQINWEEYITIQQGFALLNDL